MKVYVHVGLARAGSTFLQNRIFPRLSGVHYLGKTRTQYPEWLKRWHYLNDHDFSRDQDAIRRTVEGQCRPGHVPLISSELFTMWGGMSGSQARRIHAIFPRARVLLVLRDPLDRMCSFYKKIVEADGFHEPLEDLIDWNPLPFVFYKRKPICLADYRYDEVVSAYETVFGPSELCILKFEDLAANGKAFLSRLAEFIGIQCPWDQVADLFAHKDNASRSDAEIRVRRMRNFAETVHRVLPGFKADPRRGSWDGQSRELMSPDLRSRIVERLKDACGAYYGKTQNHG